MAISYQGYDVVHWLKAGVQPTLACFLALETEFIIKIF